VLAARVHQHQRGTSHGLDSAVINRQISDWSNKNSVFTSALGEKESIISAPSRPLFKRIFFEKSDELIAILHSKQSVNIDEANHQSKHQNKLVL
jgi:hypothetical protein